VKFFPKYGHYILSGGMDGMVKLWSTNGDRRLVRDYIGHNMPVRDLTF